MWNEAFSGTVYSVPFFSRRIGARVDCRLLGNEKMQSRLGSGAVQLGLGFLLASSALQSGAQRSPSLDRSQVEREVMGLFDR